MEDNILHCLLTKDEAPQQKRIVIHSGWCGNNDFFMHEPGDKVVRALVYTRFRSPRNAERFWDYERERGIQYCGLQGYQVLALAESVEDGNIREDVAINKILEMAQNALIDVVVLTSIDGFNKYPEGFYWLLDRLYDHGVKTDWVGCGNLDEKIHHAYIEQSQKQEQMVSKMLTDFVSRMKAVEGTDGIC